MQYVIHAMDATDADAYDRRLAARAAHFESTRQLKSNGQFIIGGALLDSAGKMIGSMMVLEFETDEQRQVWYEQEPYIRGRVWQNITINPFRKADI